MAPRPLRPENSHPGPCVPLLRAATGFANRVCGVAQGHHAPASGATKRPSSAQPRATQEAQPVQLLTYAGRSDRRHGPIPLCWCLRRGRAGDCGGRKNHRAVRRSGSVGQVRSAVTFASGYRSCRRLARVGWLGLRCSLFADQGIDEAFFLKNVFATHIVQHGSNEHLKNESQIRTFIQRCCTASQQQAMFP